MRAWLLAAAVAKSALFLVWTQRGARFERAALDFGLTLLLGAGLLVPHRGERGVIWLLSGIALAAVGGAAQRPRFRISGALDPNTVFHLIETAACVPLYRGGLSFMGH
jgi:hypothetical protein